MKIPSGRDSVFVQAFSGDAVGCANRFGSSGVDEILRVGFRMALA
jgi:hypothetical protein